eukprot:736510-Pleurochrysis_carterae.AAC.2
MGPRCIANERNRADGQRRGHADGCLCCRNLATAREAYTTMRGGGLAHAPHKDVVVPPLYTEPGKESPRQEEYLRMGARVQFRFKRLHLHRRVHVHTNTHKLVPASAMAKVRAWP